MTDTREENISMNLKLLTFAMALVVSVVGFFIQRTLNSIDENLLSLKIELQAKADIMANHETRLQLLEKFNLLNK